MREYSKLKLAGLSIILSTPLIGISTAHAAAFALNEQNISGLGNAYAGRAAVAEDASTSFYNPAGLVFMNKHQVVGSLANPLPKFDMKANRVVRQSAAGNATVVTQGKAKDDAGSYVPLPAFHIAGPLVNNFYYGLSVTAPFGLKTEYSKTSQVRYFGTKSELKTIDINPTLAYKINNQWSVGGGVSAQYAKAKLNAQVDNAAPGENINLDGEAHNTADNWGFGYNLGVLFQPTSDTRLGVNFRSKIKQTVKGSINIDIPTGGVLSAVAVARGLVHQKAEATVTLPEVLSISAFQTITPEWDVMGDITLTNWHRFKKLVIKYPDTVLADSRTEEKFNDTIKVSTGANYKYSKDLIFKFGLSYDDSPVSRKHRNIRIPDSDRYWVAFGAKYNVSKDFVVDAGYTHIFVKSAKVYEVPTARPLASANASFSSSINLFGVQGSYNFA